MSSTCLQVTASCLLVVDEQVRLAFCLLLCRCGRRSDGLSSAAPGTLHLAVLLALKSTP